MGLNLFKSKKLFLFIKSSRALSCVSWLKITDVSVTMAVRTIRVSNLLFTIAWLQGCVTHPASYITGTGNVCGRVKWPGLETDHLYQYNTNVEARGSVVG
jgi:hypothetical protein